MASARSMMVETVERDVVAFLGSYANAWWNADPRAIRGMFVDDPSYVCRITSASLGNSFASLMEYAHDMTSAPENLRKLTIEHLFVESDGAFACASIVIEGMMLHDLTKFPVVDHLHLVNTDNGWRVLQAYAAPRPAGA